MPITTPTAQHFSINILAFAIWKSNLTISKRGNIVNWNSHIIKLEMYINWKDIQNDFTALISFQVSYITATIIFEVKLQKEGSNTNRKL